MAKRLNKNGCQPTVHTSNSLIVPVHMHPSLGQTAAKASTSLRAALSGKAWETKRCYSLTQVGINCFTSVVSSIYAILMCIPTTPHFNFALRGFL